MAKNTQKLSICSIFLCIPPFLCYNMHMKIEVTFDEIAQKDRDTYEIIDIRDASDFEHGNIPGSKNMSMQDIYNHRELANKELYICCRNGTLSLAVARQLQQDGFLAYNLQGGYVEWLTRHLKMVDDTQKAQDVEKSLQKKFHDNIFSKFCKAINEYDLLQPGDKVAVCISGGKDSMLMAKLFQELKKHNKFPFEVVYLVMDPGYSPENRDIIEKNAKMLNIPVTIFNTNIFESVYSIPKYPCYICARMRRGYLYAKAKELGCNKIALGHHYDDVIETTLMSMLYGGQIETMMPKLHSENFDGLELIRPLYLIREKDIKHWRDFNDLHFIQCACKFTDTCTAEACQKNTGSKRKQVKKLIENLAKTDPQIEGCIFRSTQNVNLAKLLGFKDKNGVHHNFLDDYVNNNPNKK